MSKVKKIQEKLVNVHVMSYEDVKGDLKGYFNEFMRNPKKFGVEDKGLIKTITKMGGLSKHLMWKKFKDVFGKKMLEMSTKKEASVFLKDFEDGNHELLTVRQLEKIIADPENPDFGLEKATIKYIKSKDFNKKAFISHVIKIDPDLEVDVESDPHGGYGHKILSFLVGIWKKIFPIVDKIIDTLVDLGTTALKKVLDKHVPEYLKDVVEDTVDNLGDGLKEVDDLVNDLVIGSVETKEKVEEKTTVEVSGENEVVENI